ncbi:MAG: hypothetical protein ABSG74_03320 [Candidatus Bathyarchaeia archaeon]|jgi:hypothetical protein
MSLPRASNVAYASVLLLIIIGIVCVYSYSTSPYNGVVEIGFHVQVIAYNLDGGDYAFITFDGLAINFSRTIPLLASNQTAKITSYLGQLHKPLNLSLNLTMSSLLNHIVLQTNNIEFAGPGTYVVKFVHLLRDIPPGVYLVNLTYTGSVHQNYPYQIWTSMTYYYEVE